MRHPLLHLILVSLAACGTREEGVACALVEEGTTTCPHPDDVDLDEISDPWDCDNVVVKMLSEAAPVPEPAFQDGSLGCCYDVIQADRSPGSECIVGRPYLHDRRPVLAGLDAPEGPARAWADLARAEHASVAAFAKLTLQLMAHGAPTGLLARAAAATADEVRHAEICAGVARGLGAAPSFGPFPFPAPVEARGALAALATEAVREGCVGETLSALATREAAARATDPSLAEALRGIADDEDRHAALSWAIVAWAIRTGGAEVRAAVAAAFREPAPWSAHATTDGLEAHGLLGPTAARQVVDRGLREVIGPAANALLAA